MKLRKFTFREGATGRVQMAAKRRRTKKPTGKGQPSKMIINLMMQLSRKAAPKMYKAVEDAAEDSSQMGSPITVKDAMEVMLSRIDREFARDVETYLLKIVESAFQSKMATADPDRVEVKFSPVEGYLTMNGKFMGESVIDPEGDVEIPSSDDLHTDRIEQAFKSLGASSYSVDWNPSNHPRYNDMWDILYTIRAAWQFDPRKLADQVFDKSKIESAISRGEKRAT